MAEPLLRLRVQVRFSDCDPLGHVNNAVYLTYLEQARIVLWRHQLGVQLGRAGEGGVRGQRFILARAEIDFRSQAFDGDELEVRLSLAGFGRSTATYDYEVVDLPTGRLVAAAKTVQVWFDYDAEIRFWIYVYLDGGVLQGYTAAYGAWVEGGIITSCVLDRLMQRLGRYVGRVDRMVGTALSLANSFGPLRRQYFLPGRGSMSGSTEDDVSLVLVRQ